MNSTVMNILVFLYAGQSHRILLAFEGQYCMAVLLGENLDTLRLANFDVITQIL